MTRSKKIENFPYGIIDDIEAKSIPSGSASNSLNWTTEGDKVALRRGMKLIGTELTGSGKVTGIHTGRKADGTDITFYSAVRKIKYYDTTTEDWIENGTNIIPLGASAEDLAFSDYHSLAGAQVWYSSPNSGLYKIMTANPGSYSDMSETTHRGYIRIKQNRIFLWNRVDDASGIYLSWIDAGNTTSVSTENIGTGDGSEKTFTNTLAFKAGGAKRTCYGISVTDSVETFSDDYNGVLTGDAGGTGTINYTTGAISITFNSAPAGAQAITADYEWEDSTDDGLADFAQSATRLAGEGEVFRQDDAGVSQTVLSYDNVEYCLHTKKAYALTITADDTNATNLVYRDKVGIPNWRAAVETGDGIYYLDNTDETEPRVRLIKYSYRSEKVLPVNKSTNLDLSDYRFNNAVMFEYGDLILLACRHKDQTYNNTLFAYDRRWKSWDRHDYWVNCFAINNGSLWTGDSISKNVWELFSGLDDDEAEIYNYWIGNLSNLGIKNLKKVKRLPIEGNIGPNQEMDIYLSYDNGAFTKVGTISGDGSYVDRSQKVYVGSMTVGTGTIGGDSGDITAYHYYKELTINSDRFEKCSIKFQATKLGWCDVSSYEFLDIRKKRRKLPIKYR